MGLKTVPTLTVPRPLREMKSHPFRPKSVVSGPPTSRTSSDPKPVLPFNPTFPPWIWGSCSTVRPRTVSSPSSNTTPTWSSNPLGHHKGQDTSVTVGPVSRGPGTWTVWTIGTSPTVGSLVGPSRV